MGIFLLSLSCLIRTIRSRVICIASEHYARTRCHPLPDSNPMPVAPQSLREFRPRWGYADYSIVRLACQMPGLRQSPVSGGLGGRRSPKIIVLPANGGEAAIGGEKVEFVEGEALHTSRLWPGAGQRRAM